MVRGNRPFAHCRDVVIPPCMRIRDRGLADPTLRPRSISRPRVRRGGVQGFERVHEPSEVLEGDTDEFPSLIEYNYVALVNLGKDAQRFVLGVLVNLDSHLSAILCVRGAVISVMHPRLVSRAPVTVLAAPLHGAPSDDRQHVTVFPIGIAHAPPPASGGSAPSPGAAGARATN